jgi:hypothetical protein
MADASHRTTSEKQAVKRAEARKESKQFRHRALDYFIKHRWLPKSLRKSK